MPSGGSTMLPDDDWEYIKRTYDIACRHGLQYEWLQFFIGGLAIDRKSIRDAADDAAIEWDF